MIQRLPRSPLGNYLGKRPELRRLAIFRRLRAEISSGFGNSTLLQDALALFDRAPHCHLKLLCFAPGKFQYALLFQPFQSPDFRFKIRILRTNLPNLPPLLRRVAVLPRSFEDARFFGDRLDLIPAAARFGQLALAHAPYRRRQRLLPPRQSPFNAR